MGKKIIKNRTQSKSEVFLAVLTCVASRKFTDTLTLNTQHPHSAPCIPSHGRRPTNAARNTAAQSQDCALWTAGSRWVLCLSHDMKGIVMRLERAPQEKKWDFGEGREGMMSPCEMPSERELLREKGTKEWVGGWGEGGDAWQNKLCWEMS